MRKQVRAEGQPRHHGKRNTFRLKINNDVIVITILPQSKADSDSTVDARTSPNLCVHDHIITRADSGVRYFDRIIAKFDESITPASDKIILKDPYELIYLGSPAVRNCRR